MISPSVDLVCADTAFVDLTFAGLEALPEPGRERYARDFLRSPGGAAISAIGAARLGLEVVLASPLGSDPEGDYLRDRLRAEGVGLAGAPRGRTAVTVVLPAGPERAFATFDPREEPALAGIESLRPRAVLLSLGRIADAPPEPWLYLTAGDADADEYAGRMPYGAERARALIVNESEARRLSGAPTAEAAAGVLGEHAPCVVVTRGPRGAVASNDGELLQVEGDPAHAVDSTGAGDLFAAAYVWADLRGSAPLERLRWADLYAGLSVRVPTAVAGAVTRAALIEAGAERGLSAPGREAIAPAKEAG